MVREGPVLVAIDARLSERTTFPTAPLDQKEPPAPRIPDTGPSRERVKEHVVSKTPAAARRRPDLPRPLSVGPVRNARPLLGTGAIEVIAGRVKEGHALTAPPVLLGAVLVIIEPARNAIPATPAERAAVILVAEDDPTGKPALLTPQAAAAWTALRPLITPSAFLPAAIAFGQGVAGITPAPSGGTGPPRYQVPVAAIAIPLRVLEMGPIVALGLPMEATGTIDPRLRGLAAIRTGPPPGLATLIRGRLIAEDGSPGQPRAYEEPMGTASIPRPPMARSMTPEANGLGSRPPAERPAIAVAHADGLGGAELLLLAPRLGPAIAPRAVGQASRANVTLPARASRPSKTSRARPPRPPAKRVPGLPIGARAPLGTVEPNASVGGEPIVATPAVTQPAPAEPIAAAILASRRRPPALPSLLSEARVDGPSGAMDARHDAGEVPVAGRPPGPASPTITTTGQLTTRPMGRLLRMQGVATKPKPPAVVGPRRRTCP